MSLCDEIKNNLEVPKVHANTDREFIEMRTKEFLERGKQITVVSAGATGDTDFSDVNTFIATSKGTQRYTAEELLKAKEKRLNRLRKTKSQSGHLYVYFITSRQEFNFSKGNETYFRSKHKHECVDFRNRWFLEKGLEIPD